MKHATLTLMGIMLFAGCVSKEPNPIVYENDIHHIQKVNPVHEYIKEQKIVPKIAKKRIKLKKIEDTNYSTHYMYPEDTKAAKKDPIVTRKHVKTAIPSMTKEACIAMIGQEKFDRYTAIFDSEVSSIKRCAILKAMKK